MFPVSQNHKVTKVSEYASFLFERGFTFRSQKKSEEDICEIECLVPVIGIFSQKKKKIKASKAILPRHLRNESGSEVSVRLGAGRTWKLREIQSYCLLVLVPFFKRTTTICYFQSTFGYKYWHSPWIKKSHKTGIYIEYWFFGENFYSI